MNTKDNLIEDAVRRVLRGDRKAFAAIVERYDDMLWKTVAYFVRDRTLVEEVVQTTFEKAYFALDAHRSDRDLGAWLKTIARNEAKTQLRRVQTRRKGLMGCAERLAMNALADDLESDRVESLKRFLGECLQKLSGRLRELIRLRYEGEVSITDLAEKMKQSRHSIDVALSRTRAALRECINDKEKRYAEAE